MSNKLKKMKQAADRRKAAMKPKEKQFIYHLDAQTMKEVYKLSGISKYVKRDDVNRVTRNDIYVAESVTSVPIGNFTGSKPYSVSLSQSIISNADGTLNSDDGVVRVKDSDYFDLGGFGKLLDDFKEEKIPYMLPFNTSYLPQKKFEIVISDVVAGYSEVPFKSFQGTTGSLQGDIRRIFIDNDNLSIELVVVDSETKLFAVTPTLIKARFSDDYTIEYDSSSNNLLAVIALQGYCNHIEHNAIMANCVESLADHYKNDIETFNSVYGQRNFSKRKMMHDHIGFMPISFNCAIVLHRRMEALADTNVMLQQDLAMDDMCQIVSCMTYRIHNILTIFAFLYIRQVQCIVSPNSTEHPKVPYVDKSGSVSEAVIFKLIDQKCVQYIYENNRNPYKGCSSKSPHEREEHMRYYKSGKAVKVKACSINGGVPKNTFIVKSKVA